MSTKLRLISHKLCPYVQRAVIVATERGIAFERVDIDLANKPDWFLKLSPTGRVPVLEVTDEQGTVHVLFESAVIAEYLDEISGSALLPASALLRARQRAWVEFASTVLAGIARLYSAPTAKAFDDAKRDLASRFGALEQAIDGPWFAGESFGLVDAAFAPAFRYLEVFDRVLGSVTVQLPPKVRAWADALAARPSVGSAVGGDYADRLVDFVLTKNSHLARQFERHLLKAA